MKYIENDIIRRFVLVFIAFPLFIFIVFPIYLLQIIGKGLVDFFLDIHDRFCYDFSDLLRTVKIGWIGEEKYYSKNREDIVSDFDYYKDKKEVR